MTRIAIGNYTTYYGPSGYNHNAVLTGLLPATKYYYVVGSNGTAASSFVTTNSSDSMKIAVYGDMGIKHSADLASLITKDLDKGAFQFVMHLGDISYANMYEGQYEESWNNWFSLVEPISSKVPYMVTVGNHEYSTNPGSPDKHFLSNFTAFKHKFRMPYLESGGEDNMYYSYDQGLAHIISMSSETGYPGSPRGKHHGGQEFMEWFENDLKKADLNRDKVPWIFVLCHRPIYSAHKGQIHHNDPIHYAEHLQSAIEPLLSEYKVNIYFSGHKHHYERQYPVYNSKLLGKTYDPPKSAVHIISGAGGNVEGLTGFDKEKPDWHAVGYHDSYGYGILDVKDSKEVTWKFYSDSGKEVDHVKITNWGL